MSDDLYFRLIQHIDALFDDGKLSSKDLIRLSNYALELGESPDKTSSSRTDSRKLTCTKSANQNNEIEEIVSDVLRRTYR